MRETWQVCSIVWHVCNSHFEHFHYFIEVLRFITEYLTKTCAAIECVYLPENEPVSGPGLLDQEKKEKWTEICSCFKRLMKRLKSDEVSIWEGDA